MLVRMTKQRDVLVDILKNTKSHPTAEWVWEEAKKLIPAMSFATVYRNLHTLVNIGRVRRVDAGDGKEHFDYDVSPHAHRKCVCCGAIDDIFLKESLQKDLEAVENASYQLIYNGICDRCKNKNEKKGEQKL